LPCEVEGLTFLVLTCRWWQVPLLQSLTKQERMVLADALMPKRFSEGEMIIEEGDVSPPRRSAMLAISLVAGGDDDDDPNDTTTTTIMIMMTSKLMTG
jgi:hypothetical protein